MGLNDDEHIAQRYRHGNEDHVLVIGLRGDDGRGGVKASWERMGRLDRTTTDEGEPAWTVKPITSFGIGCLKRYTVVELDGDGNVGAEVTDSAYRLVVRDSHNGEPHREATVWESAIADNRRRAEWQVPLELSRRVRVQEASGALVNLVHAVVSNEGDVVQVVDATGPVRDGGRVVFVTGKGDAFDHRGRTETLGGQLSRKTKQTRPLWEMGYEPEPPDWRASRTLDGLAALCGLIEAHGDRGVSGMVVGQLVSSLMAGVALDDDMPHARSVVELVGPSMSGKTAFAQQATYSQTRTLWGEVGDPPQIAPAAPGESGGTTPRGIIEHHRNYGGSVAVMDDAIKAGWDEKHQLKAHRSNVGRVVDAIVGGGAMQATAQQSGPPTAAEGLDLRCSAIITAEKEPPVPSLTEDSHANRTAFLWWAKEDRCDQETFDRLKSRDATLARNDGLRACLQVLLEDPATLAEGYRLARDVLEGAGIGPRIAKTYARCLAGLHVLGAALDRCGDKAERIDFYGLLDDVLSGAVAQAQRMVTYGTVGGGDELAVANPVEAFREAARSLFSQGQLYVDFGSGEAGAAPSPPPARAGALPPGVQQEDYGWSWRTGPDAPLTQAGRVLVGRWVTRAPSGRRHDWQWRVEMSPTQWAALHDHVAKWCRARGYRFLARDQLQNALETAGVFRKIRPRTVVYQLDGAWLSDITTTYAEPEPIEPEPESHSQGQSEPVEDQSDQVSPGESSAPTPPPVSGNRSTSHTAPDPTTSEPHQARQSDSPESEPPPEPVAMLVNAFGAEQVADDEEMF